MKTAVPSHAHEPVNAATLLGPTTTMPTEHGEGTRRGPITGQTRNTGQYWAILGDTGHTGRYCRYCGAASRAPGCACRPPKPPEQSSASGAEGGIVSHGSREECRGSQCHVSKVSCINHQRATKPSRAEASGAERAERSRAEPDDPRSNCLSRESTPEPCYFCRANGPHHAEAMSHEGHD